LFAEFSEATNYTLIGLIAAAHFLKAVNGVTLVLLGSASRDARVTLIRVLSPDRPSAVRDGEGQDEEEQGREKKSENSSGHLYFLLTD
jgi:hypothetical protein